MAKIDPLLSEYGESHKDDTNKLIHWVCVPLIFFSIVGLLWSIPAGPLQQWIGNGNDYVNWATIALICVTIYYIRLSVPLAFGMFLFAGACLFFADYLDTQAPWPLWLISVVIFVLAWVGQFYGHKVEGKKPSFLKDLQFLLIGPAWLMHFIYRKAGISY